MPGQIARSAPQTAGLISARLILDAGEASADIAARLGLDPGQLSWGGDDALHAELDCPPGVWRIYPALHTALWISARPTFDPPPVRPGRTLALAEIVRRLRRRGIRFRDLRVHQGGAWTKPLRAVEALAVIKTSDPYGISAVWSSADRHPVRIEIFADGILWAPSPGDAAWWVGEVSASERALP